MDKENKKKSSLVDNTDSRPTCLSSCRRERRRKKIEREKKQDRGKELHHWDSTCANPNHLTELLQLYTIKCLGKHVSCHLRGGTVWDDHFRQGNLITDPMKVCFNVLGVCAKGPGLFECDGGLIVAMEDGRRDLCCRDD